MAEDTMMLSTGISLTPNWDKNGRIFYTDENGEIVKQTINPYKYLTNSLRAIKSNLGDKLLSFGQERSKPYYAPFEDIKEQYNKGAIDSNQVQKLAEGRLNQEIEDTNKYQRGENTRGAIGSLVSAASFHPFLNIPYVGTGLGGAMYDLGQGIVEGDNAGDLWNRAKRGFAIGETVGAIPYVGKGLGKTKVGSAVTNKVGNALKPIGDKFTNSKLYDALMTEVAPIKAIKRLKAGLDYKKLGTKAPNFQKFYEGSVLYDEAGNPLILKHGTPRGGFDAFDLAKAGESNSNEAKLGVWFGDENSNVAENFANNSWWGNNPQVYKTYANMKNPKIYNIEQDNYNSILENLKSTRLQNELDLINGYKPFTKDYVQKDFDKYLRDDIYGYKDNLIEKLSDLSDTLEYFEKQGYTPDSAQYQYMLERKFDNDFRGVLPEKQQELIAYVIQNKDKLKNLKKIKSDIQYLPSDSYSAFLDDIDKYNTRRTHGLRDHWGANPEDIQNYKQDLINQGYDGIIIKNTTTDAEGSGANRLNQYVVFNPEQIKSVENSGLFDTTRNSLYDKAPKIDTNLYDKITGSQNTGATSDSLYDKLMQMSRDYKQGKYNPLKYRGNSVKIDNISPKQKEYIFNEINSTISEEEKAKGTLKRLLHNYDEKADYLYHVKYDKNGNHKIIRSIKIDDDFYNR